MVAYSPHIQPFKKEYPYKFEGQLKDTVWNVRLIGKEKRAMKHVVALGAERL